MGGCSWHVCLLVASLTFALGSDLEPTLLRGYGEPCTCDSDCEFSKWLVCSDGFCQCLSSTFRHDQQNCVVRLNHKCFEVSQDYREYKELPPSIRCVHGAFCSISAGGLCACNTYGFYEEGENCLPRKDFDARCQLSVQCKSDLCSAEGKCSCREGQYYHTARERCLGLLGAFCFTDQDCTDNSVCNAEAGKCVCAAGYQGANCQTMLSYGASCDPLTPCNNVELSCFNGLCLCRYSDHQIYDSVMGSCQSLVSSAPCQGDHTCVPNAKCQLRDSISQCQCKNGYVEMGDGSCEKFSGYGARCEKDEECDPLTPLVCKDSVCNCKDSLTIYDPAGRLCRGLVGFRNCKAGSSSCVQNAECVQVNPSLPWKCLCSPSFTPAMDRTCHSIN